ncbi:DUF4012 domain-containing protein [Mycolicibacterium austroafricanum]|uniref:DUF4012 domain-containing protein n=1 Tax=Mycolicibacterium austroafricanum TaxID=39687 RepID=UPI001ABEF051|nr:DUF4012 domain-containing protein [Mycolicibacterium austroafricanum]QRZ08325.1 DUF4012 domain-containing protein [Mycolicibacterium austroafricanum]QZT69977.1 DUF4012 domain-containing protein [Mycolicibacterium austroafricanum]
MNKFSRRPFGDEPAGDDDADPPENEDEQPNQWLHDRHGAVWTVLVLLVFVIAFGVWLGIRAFDAKSGLEQARDSAQQSKDALLEGNTEDASRFAEEAQHYAEAARDATHSLPWNVVSVIPWLGSPFKAGQQIADVVLGLASDVLKPSTDVGVAISPDQLYSNGRVDVQLLRSEEPQLSDLAEDAARLNAEAGSIADPGYLSLLRDARSQLQEQTSDLAGMLENAALAARLVPSMMGADGPRTYFMGFQTNAEARGTGGLLGGFGILRFDNGAPVVDDLGKNTELTGAVANVDLGPEFNQQYGFTNPKTDFRNSNLSSHFPYAAQIWKSMWAEKTGIDVDGVIAIDPIALSYVLGAVGPVVLADGEVITRDNVVELTESTAYVRFPVDQIARKNYLQDIANAVVQKITGPVESPRALLEALGKAVGERRIAVWSSALDDQALLEETPLAHAVPDDPAPYAGVVINNLAGNKMDYYLEREIEYAADGCGAETRMSTVTVRLKNKVQAEAPLPDYVAGTQGLSRDIPFEVPRGTMVTSVRLLATENSSMVGVLANGERTTFTEGVERGHPNYEVQVLIPPGQSGELVFRLSEPTVSGEPRVPIQPLVDNVQPVVSVPQCAE